MHQHCSSLNIKRLLKHGKLNRQQAADDFGHLNAISQKYRKLD